MSDYIIEYGYVTEAKIRELQKLYPFAHTVLLKKVSDIEKFLNNTMMMGDRIIFSTINLMRSWHVFSYIVNKVYDEECSLIFVDEGLCISDFSELKGKEVFRLMEKINRTWQKHPEPKFTTNRPVRLTDELIETIKNRLLEGETLQSIALSMKMYPTNLSRALRQKGVSAIELKKIASQRKHPKNSFEWEMWPGIGFEPGEKPKPKPIVFGAVANPNGFEPSPKQSQETNAE